MHYKAEFSINKEEYSIIGYIPTFLLMDKDDFEVPDLFFFLEIMKEEIEKGNSFDKEFIRECGHHLENFSHPGFGFSTERQKLCREWLIKIKELNKQNIINSHKNKAKLKINRLNAPKTILTVKQ